MSTGQIIGRIS